MKYVNFIKEYVVCSFIRSIVYKIFDQKTVGVVLKMKSCKIKS